MRPLIDRIIGRGPVKDMDYSNHVESINTPRYMIIRRAKNREHIFLSTKATLELII